MYSNLRVERLDAIAIVTLDNPPVNAISFAAYDEIRQAFHQLAEDDDLRAIVLTGAGDRVFCGGNDVRDFVELDYEGATEALAGVRISYNAIIDCPIPIVAAINGAAVGTGLVLPTLCDIRLASSEAVFALPEIDVGVLGGGKHLMRVATLGMTRLMMYTGRRIGALEAQRIGMVDEIHPPERLLEAAIELAREIASKSPAAIRLAKLGLTRVETMGMKEAYEYECTLTAEVRRTPEAREAAMAFLEKRQPRFLEA